MTTNEFASRAVSALFGAAGRRADRNERWVPVAGFPAYVVSDRGRVMRARKSTPLRPATVRGYQAVTLHVENSAHRRLVHRLVLESFVGPCPPGMQCRHLDGSRDNNCLSNLVWGTVAENTADRITHGTHGRVVCDEDIPRIRALRAGGRTLQSIGDEFGLTREGVRLITLGRTWRHIPC